MQESYLKGCLSIPELNPPVMLTCLVSTCHTALSTCHTDLVHLSRVRESYVKGCLSMPELGGDEMMSKATEDAMANVPSIAQETVLEMLTRATPLLQRVGKGIEVSRRGPSTGYTLFVTNRGPENWNIPYS
jgi:hypothetical protein